MLTLTVRRSVRCRLLPSTWTITRLLSTCGPTKKTWTMSTCLDDHYDVFTSLPGIMGAYVGKDSIHPTLNESIMVTVNSENQCPYCEGLHGQLARMAGVDDYQALQSATSVSTARAVVDEPAITFARIFAENNGRGPAVREAYVPIESAYGPGQAASIRALCWFLQWGSIGGNTLNAVMSRVTGTGSPRHSSWLFDATYGVYYAPLFLVIAGMNKGLTLMPRVPSGVSAGIGVMLTVAAGSWMAPIGVLAVLRHTIRK